jgi:hypothetical protein
MKRKTWLASLTTDLIGDTATANFAVQVTICCPKSVRQGLSHHVESDMF